MIAISASRDGFHRDSSKACVIAVLWAFRKTKWLKPLQFVRAGVSWRYPNARVLGVSLGTADQNLTESSLQPSEHVGCRYADDEEKVFYTRISSYR